MAQIKKKFGKMPCETCGDVVTVKVNDLGTLSYSCQECDAAPYAKAGTVQHGIWSRKAGGEETDGRVIPAHQEPTQTDRQTTSSGTFFG